ncbi:MAG: tRNA preQ1(34) S-adenosylmethionine ribosyltransferase-isomerase QueA [Thermodesulfovibrio sp.]|nr:tRNA preQ1(34) S-adenosylmethionine ribosyltransferase-isomerase QueA [Thermodesulfovibrio sp.]
MKTIDLEYNLPTELIAQQPLKERDKAKLLVLHKDTGQIEHRIFFEIVEYLNSGDMLIINNTKVIPARLIVRKPTGGKIEILLIKEKQIEADSTVWEIMTKGNYEGKVIIDDREFFIRKNSHGKEIVFSNMKPNFVKNFIYEKGFMPLPPYIKRKPGQEDREDYQTVYAKQNGSIAAPTAGLHFTKKLLEEIIQKGVLLKEITLHVGIGTFKTITDKNLEGHKMDSEYFEIERKLLDEIYNVKKSGKKVFFVGTTTTRALEGWASGFFTDMGSNNEKIRGMTDIFIYPGYEFKIVDALITNFHLPKSTPLALVYAFCDSYKVKKAYEEAIQKKYRFFSYGDAMLII